VVWDELPRYAGFTLFSVCSEYAKSGEITLWDSRGGIHCQKSRALDRFGIYSEEYLPARRFPGKGGLGWGSTPWISFTLMYKESWLHRELRYTFPEKGTQWYWMNSHTNQKSRQNPDRCPDFKNPGFKVRETKNPGFLANVCELQRGGGGSRLPSLKI